MPSPRTLLFVAIVTVASALAGCSRPVLPNVLVITIDTLRADRLGCYGFGLARSPRIDGLAEQGVRCEDAVASAPITMPSHASIFTGLFPPAHGVRDNGTYSLGEGAVTLAERLKSHGYATQAFVSAIVLNHRYNLSQGFDGYDDNLWSENEPKPFMIRERPSCKTAARFIEWLDGWVDRNKKAQKADGPFFAWIHFFDPHQPMSASGADLVLSPTSYDAEIAGADRAVGKVLDRLKDHDLLEKTLVVLTADHGESLGEHQEKTHAIFIYDATVRVPLIFRYPKSFPKGDVYKGPARSVDIVPTILGVLGLPGAAQTQGVDLGPAFRGEIPPPKLLQYSESLLAELGFGMAPLQGIRKGGFKWIRAPRPELYDLTKDRGELSNLASKDPRRGALLDQELSRVLADCERRALAAPENPMDKETMETLMSLGYLARPADKKSLGGIDPKDGIGIYNQVEDARHLAQRGQWAKAEKLLRETLDRIPKHVTARNVLGYVQIKTGRLAEARETYARSFQDDPNQARVLAMQGVIALTEGQDREAEKLFLAALKITPGFVEAMSNLGFIEALRGNDDKAHEWYQRALKEDPGFPRGHRLSADLFFERGDYARAREHYKKVLASEPNDFESMLQLGTCERRLGDTKEAASRFHQAARLRPDSWMPDYNLACLEAASGRAEEALSILQKIPDKGFEDAAYLQDDPDLASVRKLPGYQSLAKRIRASVNPA